MKFAGIARNNNTQIPMQDPLLQQFLDFGLVGLIGFVLGLERDMAGSANPHAGPRDFILVSLIGAVSAYLALLFDNSWIILAGFSGTLAFLLCGYWVDRAHDSGITTEVAALFTFFLGVLVIFDATEIAIALAIATLIILSQKQAIATITNRIQIYELQAAIKFLVITFIVLPVLPQQPISTYLSTPLGTVSSFDHTTHQLTITLDQQGDTSPGDTITLFWDKGKGSGILTLTESAANSLTGILASSTAPPEMGNTTREALGVSWLNTMLGAIKPYKIWLIVVLVSLISLIGYVAVKVLGPGAGIGLTGFIGGLASSTVTTVAFARRSRENPSFNNGFAVAILLASSVMFPRLLLEIAVVNQALMKNMALPLITMAVTGLLLAAFFARRPVTGEKESQTAMRLDNPFCLKSAVTFGLIFSFILMTTRLAATYLGNTWLPAVAVISGLVDADAIAFSLSDAHKAGIVSLDWASFNLVLGAISNTAVKLFFVFTLGDKKLFKQLAIAFTLLSLVGLATTYLYYFF